MFLPAIGVYEHIGLEKLLHGNESTCIYGVRIPFCICMVRQTSEYGNLSAVKEKKTSFFRLVKSSNN